MQCIAFTTLCLCPRRLLSANRLKSCFFFLSRCTASYIFCGVLACGSFHFFLVIPSPISSFPPFHALIAIQGARRRSHLREVFSLRRCTLLSRIMKLESRPICGPCGAIFFNYSYRSSAPSGGRERQVRRVVANKKALFEGERRLENAIASRS